MKELEKNKHSLYLFVLILLFLTLFIFGLPYFFRDYYTRGEMANTVFSNKVEEEKIPTYVKTPEVVKGIYMTSWVAGTPNMREPLIKLIDETELNTIVIDIKDYSGKIVFSVSDPKLKAFGSEEIRVPDLRDFIERLHKKNIYVIGRLAVFQDAYFVKERPDLAVKTKNGQSVWKDRKGISWIDPGSQEYWDYIVRLANESRKIGFDEINFDYIRFPSDGNMNDISYPFSSTTPKTVILKNFFSYLHDNLKDSGLKISADLFGMTTTASDDMGIGQVIENAFPYFDYISPMVYPSHYPLNYEGMDDPEKYPYQLIKISMGSAIERRDALASSTRQTIGELRPWLQDFGLRRTYGPEEVRAQIKATNDLGIKSWLLWSASNRYNSSALYKE